MPKPWQFALLVVAAFMVPVADATSSATAASRGTSFTSSGLAAMERTVRGVMDQTLYPGVAVGVWAPGRGTWIRAFGDARLPGKALRLSDMFRVGSVTRTFTATVVLQLVQEGKLALDDRLARFEPWVPQADSITVEQLLNHTSGLPDLSGAAIAQVIRDPHARVDTRKEIEIAVQQPYFPQGTFHYSDPGYLLLGLIIEKVAGKPLMEEFERRIFKPPGLHHTRFAPGTRVPGPAANGYLFDRRTPVDVTRWNASWQWSAGAMVATLGDLRRWARALAEATLLSPELQERRLTFVPTGLKDISYGLGIAKFGAFLGHDGEVPEYEAMVVYSPRLKATFVAIGNASPDFDELPSGHAKVSMMELVGKLVRIVYPKAVGPKHHHLAAPTVAFRAS